MKKVIFFVLLLVGVTSCETTVKTSYLNEEKVDGATVKVYEIDGCQYIVIGSGTTRAIAHKGNCNSPIHKN